MNTWLKIALLHRYSAREKGSTIPAVFGLGLIMILIGMTMIVKLQKDQVIASAQKGTAASLDIAEGGVARALSALNLPSNAFLLTLNYDPLDPNTNKVYLGPNGIPNDGDEENTAIDQWSNPPSNVVCNTSGSLPAFVSDTLGLSGNYGIKAYRYDPGNQTGNLLIEGNQETAVSRVQVSIQVVQKTGLNSFPGLYASNSINLGNNDVLKVAGDTGTSANVICKDCQLPNPSTQCSGGQPTDEGLSAAVGKGSNSVVDGKIFLGEANIPPVPPEPVDNCSATSPPPCLIDLNGSLDINTTDTLPRPGDVTNRQTWGHLAQAPYFYRTTDMPLGNNVLNVNTDTAPVRLYVSGDLTLNGNGGIAHTGDPDRLAIFGTAATAQNFTISGGSSTSNLFIYAPNATVGINGGSSDPDIQGAVWAKTWVGSSSNNAEIRVPDNMPALLGRSFGSSFSKVGIQINATRNINSWQTQEAN